MDDLDNQSDQSTDGKDAQDDNRNEHDEVQTTDAGPQGPIANVEASRPAEKGMGLTPHSNLNPDPMASNSGLDVNGEFRIADKIAIGVRGSSVVIRQSHTGREVEVNADEFQAAIQKRYFDTHLKGATALEDADDFD